MIKRNSVKGGEQILLRLDSGEVRDIGIIKDGIYYTKRDPNKHLFIKNNSYAFNWELLNSLDTKTKIVVKEKGSKYILVTTVLDVLEHNEYKNFKGQGYELQVFFPRNKFNIDF